MIKVEVGVFRRGRNPSADKLSETLIILDITKNRIKKLFDYALFWRKYRHKHRRTESSLEIMHYGRNLQTSQLSASPVPEEAQSSKINCTPLANKKTDKADNEYNIWWWRS